MAKITNLERLGIAEIKNDCLWIKSGGSIGIISVMPVDFYNLKTDPGTCVILQARSSSPDAIIK